MKIIFLKLLIVVGFPFIFMIGFMGLAFRNNDLNKITDYIFVSFLVVGAIGMLGLAITFIYNYFQSRI